MPFTFVTITHTFETAADVPAAGTIDFTPVTPMHNGTTVVRKTVTALLSGTGAMSQVLAANTDPDTTPTGTTYQVTERITGQSALTYYVQVPHDQGSSLDLRTLAGWQGSTSTGGGTVSTINSEGPDGAGNIVLSASDVGAQPADGDLTGLAGLGNGAPYRAGGTWSVVSGTPDGTKFYRDDGTWASAAGGSYTSENARDDIAAALVAGPNVTIVPNDAADTITISAAASGSSGIPASTVTTKGDLIVATGNAVVNRKSVGADGTALLADSAQTTGVSWGAPTPADASVTNVKVSGTAAISADKLADGTTNKIMTATERTKLSGIATGATAWDIEQSQDAAASLFTSGVHSGISFSYNDGSNRIDATTSAAGPVIIPSLTFGSTGAAAANTTAITNAVTSAASGGKAVTLVGQGTCWVNPISVSAGVRLTVDLGVTIKNNTPSSASPMVSLAAGAVLDGYGIIDGNRAASPSTGAPGVEMSSGSVCRDVTIQQTVENGVQILSAADNCIVLNCKLFDIGAEGIVCNTNGAATASSDYTLIQGNRIERTGRRVAEAIGSQGAGIKAIGDDTTHVIGPEALRVIGNHVLDPAAGMICIEIFGWGKSTVVANNHTRGGQWGISIDACQHVTVTGNTCANHDSLGIEWANCKYGACVGNTIDGRGIMHTGISISNPLLGGPQYITCTGNVITNMDTSANAAGTGAASRCINIADGSRIVVGSGNILEPPSLGFGIRYQNSDNGITMNTNVVDGTLIKGGNTGIAVFNDATSAGAVTGLIVQNTVFDGCTNGVDYNHITNAYFSGNKFIGVTTIKSGTVTGVNDWQANYPRTANN